MVSMTRYPQTPAVVFGALLIATLAGPSSARAQTQTPAPAQAQTPTHVLDTDYVPVDKPEAKEGIPPHQPATSFFMPDVPDEWKDKTTYDGAGFSSRLTVVMLADYNAFNQDAASVSQVGTQVDQWDLRSFRFAGSGSLKFAHPVEYFAMIQIRGPDHSKGEINDVAFTDWYIGTRVGKIGQLRYGKLKEPFAYEIVGDASNLPQQERILNPF
jgi:hypothetical protein